VDGARGVQVGQRARDARDDRRRAALGQRAAAAVARGARVIEQTTGGRSRARGDEPEFGRGGRVAARGKGGEQREQVAVLQAREQGRLAQRGGVRVVADGLQVDAFDGGGGAGRGDDRGVDLGKRRRVALARRDLSLSPSIFLNPSR